MAVLLSSTSRLRRLVLLVFGFIITLLILRTPAPQLLGYKEGRPSSLQSGQSEGAQREGSSGGEGDKPVDNTPRGRITQNLRDVITWDPPVDIKDHYPPYDAYFDRDFDPNRWEEFEQYVLSTPGPQMQADKEYLNSALGKLNFT